MVCFVVFLRNERNESEQMVREVLVALLWVEAEKEIELLSSSMLAGKIGFEIVSKEIARLFLQGKQGLSERSLQINRIAPKK